MSSRHPDTLPATSILYHIVVIVITHTLLAYYIDITHTTTFMFALRTWHIIVHTETKAKSWKMAE